MAYFGFRREVANVFGGEGLGEDDLDDFEAMDEGHFLFEGLDGGEEFYFEVVPEVGEERGDCGFIGGDEVVGDGFFVVEGELGEVF